MLKWVIAAALVVAAPVMAQAAGDAAAGKEVFGKCKGCHQVGADAKNGLGPNLTCVIGRAAGTAEGYTGYSEALKKSGITWDEAKFVAWVQGPSKVVPGNKMIFPGGVKDETDRANLLAYIESECKK